jgi:hypothetical protein
VAQKQGEGLFDILLSVVAEPRGYGLIDRLETCIFTKSTVTHASGVYAVYINVVGDGGGIFDGGRLIGTAWGLDLTERSEDIY